MIRELQSDRFDSRGYTDENALTNLMLSSPDQVSQTLTRLWSEDKFESRFSFLAMTEGQGAIKEVNDVQFWWRVMGMMPHTDEVVYFDIATNPTPGIGRSLVKVLFKTRWIIPQYGLMAPDGSTQVYVHGEPEEATIAGYSGYLYTLELKTLDNAAYIDPSNLMAGSHWIMTAPNVPESGSVGNRSNVMSPGKMYNQVSFKRYTKIIQGNISNKVVPIKFDGVNATGGGEATLWINEEQRQFEVWMRVMNNHDLYISEYNRTVDGRVLLLDQVTGKEIPLAAGVKQQVKDVGNFDTYGLTLPLAKLKNTVGDIFWGETDRGTMEIVIHGGQGFGEDLHEAIMMDAQGYGSGFMQAIGDKWINGKDGYLSYGNTFTQYKTISGHIITFKHDAMFDTGLLGELDRKNGRMHPRTGYPMSSHTGVFIDYSEYGGERNVQLFQMKGQANISGVVKGLTPIPKAWGSVNVAQLANDKDESSYQVKQSRAINIKNARHCFILQSEL